MKAGTRKLSPDHKEYLSFQRDLWQGRDDVSACCKALYATLLTYENLKSNECYPCQDELARHLSTSVRSIRIWTREMEQKNLCRTKKIRFNGKWKIIYTLFVPKPSDAIGKTPELLPGKIVHFPSLNSTNSTLSTIPKVPAPSISGKVSHV